MQSLNSIWVVHPTGNVFVRALLRGLRERELPLHFFTTLGFSENSAWLKAFPIRRELARRQYPLLPTQITAAPFRELARLGLGKLGFGPSRGGKSPFSVEAVYRALDTAAASRLRQTHVPPTHVYAYEDGAFESFKSARDRGICRVYDLPIAHWQTTQRLLREEAARLPHWEPTLGISADSAEKLARKSEELQMADIVICPSRFVHDSLPESVRSSRPCIISEFGTPKVPLRPRRGGNQKLRVLFAGSLTQRKGLADLFAAMKLLNRPDIELVVMGSLLAPAEFYRREFKPFTYEPPRAHSEVLDLMQSCDILALPSIVEGRALVQQEALACGVPVIATPNAGGEDLLVDGETGFLVPIRQPAAIAEKIGWFADNRADLEEMRPACRAQAAEYRWTSYVERILEAILNWERKQELLPS